MLVLKSPRKAAATPIIELVRKVVWWPATDLSQPILVHAGYGQVRGSVQKVAQIEQPSADMIILALDIPLLSQAFDNCL